MPAVVCAAVLSFGLLDAAPAPGAMVLLNEPGGAPATAGERATLLEAAVQAKGVVLVPPLELRSRLVGAARPVAVGVPPSAEELALAAERAFDEARFEEAARQASLATGELAQGPRGAAIEERAREMQVLWGAALASMGQGAQANAHFRAVLEHDPGFVPSGDRFAPPLRRRFEKERKQVAHARGSALAVSGTTGATLIADGVPRGKTPSTIFGLPGSQGWIWLERDGITSLAHPALYGTPLPPIDVDADAALKPLAGTGPLSPPVELTPPDDASRLDAVLERIASELEVTALVSLERCAGHDCLAARVAVPDRVDRAEEIPPAGASPAVWSSAAQRLLDRAVALQQSSAQSAVARVAPVAAPPPIVLLAPPAVAAVPPAAAPDASLTSSQKSGPSPIVWGALAAVAVGVGVAVGVAVASSSSSSGMAVGIQSSPGHP